MVKIVNEYLLEYKNYYFKIIGTKLYEYISLDDLIEDTPVDTYELDGGIGENEGEYFVLFNGERKVFNSAKQSIINTIEDTEKAIKEDIKKLRSYESLLKQYK